MLISGLFFFLKLNILLRFLENSLAKSDHKYKCLRYKSSRIFTFGRSGFKQYSDSRDLFISLLNILRSLKVFDFRLESYWPVGCYFGKQFCWIRKQLWELNNVRVNDFKPHPKVMQDHHHNNSDHSEILWNTKLNNIKVCLCVEHLWDIGKIS